MFITLKKTPANVKFLQHKTP